MTRLRGDPIAGVTALCAFLGYDEPSQAQQNGALLFWCGLRDMHMVRQAITNDPKKRRIDPIDD